MIEQASSRTTSGRSPAQLREQQPAATARIAGRPRLAGVALALFLALAFMTPAWRSGPFTWWPLWHSPMLAGRGATVGVLSLLPLAAALGWLAARRTSSRTSRRLFRWGAPGISLPLAGLSLLVTVQLDLALTWRTATQLAGLALAWFVYLYIVNERPDLTLPLAIVVAGQSAIALAQFFLQSDVGLAFLGELPLDPAQGGVSVLFARDQRWLRGYGLTAHPNVLGTMLAMGLLWLLPAVERESGRRGSGWRGTAVLIAVNLGTLGLLATFSRGAWLGLALGGLAYLWPRPDRPQLGWLLRQTLPGILLAILFLAAYHDLAASRFLALETPTEAQSLTQRQEDVPVALAVIRQSPWLGVGAGRYLAAAHQIAPGAVTAHNVPLLVAAELGLIGLLLWLWLAGAGLKFGGRAAWVALLAISLFDNTLWLTTSWRAAILFALALASMQQTLSGAGAAPENGAGHEET